MTSLDQTDLKILSELQRSADLTNIDLAERVNLSPTPCARRVARLEKEGFVRGRVALLQPEKIGLSVYAFLQVTLSRQKKAHLDVFERETASWPEVLECHLVSGDFDYFLKVAVVDLTSYRDFIERLSSLDGVSQIKSSFSLKEVHYTTALPLDHLKA